MSKLSARFLSVALLGCVGITLLVLLGCGGVGQAVQEEATASTTLPHSLKGYELYSWYAAEDEQWAYALLTGTNRVKEYDEIVSGESTVTEAGWVALSARGTEDLKALLKRLPKGEELSWIGGERLSQAGTAKGELRLPPRDVTDEIKSYCQQLGLQLSVVSSS